MNLLKKIGCLPYKIKIPIVLICVGVINLTIFAIISPYLTYVDSKNILHEPFFLISTGCYLIGLGIILLLFIGIFFVSKNFIKRFFIKNNL